MNNQEEREFLALLQQVGPHTLEELVRLSGRSPSQVLLMVDHLSRSGEITLQRIGVEYHVSLNGAMA
jgi:predicted transcriptional regulator